ncbi:MAG: hypothetical protein OXG71_06575 [Rhodospirillales bacterium]|nr:hypothetical protein [Rhodospirillales bacterium]
MPPRCWPEDREAKARLSELVAALSGERVSIARHGRPAVKLVRCDRRGGIDVDRLDAARRRSSLEADGERWRPGSSDPAFSRKVPGLNDE